MRGGGLTPKIRVGRRGRGATPPRAKPPLREDRDSGGSGGGGFARSITAARGRYRLAVWGIALSGALVLLLTALMQAE